MMAVVVVLVVTALAGVVFSAVATSVLRWLLCVCVSMAVLLWLMAATATLNLQCFVIKGTDLFFYDHKIRA